MLSIFLLHILLLRLSLSVSNSSYHSYCTLIILSSHWKCNIFVLYITTSFQIPHFELEKNLYISKMANVLGFYTELGWQNVLFSEDKNLKSHTVLFLHFFKMQDNRRWNDCNCMISYMPRKVFQNSALGRYISILLCWKLYVALSL